jgi:Protein of unknown function (DUF1559)
MNRVTTSGEFKPDHKRERNHTMRYFIAVALTLGFLGPFAAVGHAHGANSTKFDPAARAAAIGPFVDDRTLFVAHLDMTAIDVQGTADGLAKLIGIPQDAFDKVASPVLATAKLAKVGVADIYFVFSLADFPSYGFLVVVGNPGIDASWIAQAMTQLSPLGPSSSRVCEPLHGHVFFGGKATFERLKRSKSPPRPELAKALEAAGDTTAKVLLLTSGDSRRVVGELLPRLPAEMGGGQTTPLVEGCLWAAAGIDLPPKKLSVRLVIQSRDAAAAKAFEVAAAGLYGALAKVPEVQALVPKFDELAKLLAPHVEGDRLVLSLDNEQGQLKSLATLIQAPVEKAQISARRAQSINNLKQLGLAMHNYYDQKKSFPAAATYDKNGKPLLSWRVYVLPYLDQSALFKEFHLDEPWDSEHNRKLIDRMPQLFRSPLSNVKDAGRTTYLLPVDSKHFVGGREVAKPAKPGSKPPDESASLFFGGPNGGAFKQITDGTSNTIMIVEADDAHAVIWTRPDDWAVDLDDPLKGLENKATGGFNTAFFDGIARFLPNTMTKKNLRALLTPAGGDVVER